MNEVSPQRKVSGLLGTGIFFIPYIFSWFTLKDGYSKNARIISFVWMVVVLLLIGSNSQKEAEHKEEIAKQEQQQRNSSKTPQDPTPAQMTRLLADISDDQIRKICAAHAIGAIAISNELNSGQFISAQEFADNVLSAPNEIAPKYLKFAEISLKKFHDTRQNKQEKYRGLLQSYGLTAYAEVENQACRTALRQALGR